MGCPAKRQSEKRRQLCDDGSTAKSHLRNGKYRAIRRNIGEYAARVSVAFVTPGCSILREVPSPVSDATPGFFVGLVAETA